MTEQLRADVAGTISPPANLYGTEPPAWASHLWDPAAQMPSLGAPVTLSDDNFATQRPRIPMRRGTPVTQLFQSSSAPSVSHARPPLGQSRLYSTRRSESISEHDDRDATVRGKKRPVEDDDAQEQGQTREKRSESRKLHVHSVHRFPRGIDTSMAIVRSAPQVGPPPAQVGALGLAALLHRLDPAPPGFQSQEAQRCSGG